MPVVDRRGRGAVVVHSGPGTPPTHPQRLLADDLGARGPCDRHVDSDRGQLMTLSWGVCFSSSQPETVSGGIDNNYMCELGGKSPRLALSIAICAIGETVFYLAKIN